MLCRRQYRILEERSRAATIWITGADQHPFARADRAHRLPNFRKRRCPISPRKVFLQVAITQAGLDVRKKLVSNSQNDVTPALASIEDAGAITESALRRLQLVTAILTQIKCQNGNNGLRKFLPIRTHVLHRSSAHAPRNPA